ncbi:MAG TPA: hypothetical protein EYG89_02770 [Bacteroidia bacterium]|nr:hypothetical protein [Bacteroidia bacterium]
MRKILLLTTLVFTIYTYSQLQTQRRGTSRVRNFLDDINDSETREYEDSIDAYSAKLKENPELQKNIAKRWEKDIAERKELARIKEKKRIENEINNLNGKFYLTAIKLDSLGLNKDVKEYLYCIERMHSINVFNNTNSWKIKLQNTLFKNEKMGRPKLIYFIKKQIAILKSLFILKRKYFNPLTIEAYNNYKSTIKLIENKVNIKK